jgi:hypothetical protein
MSNASATSPPRFWSAEPTGPAGTRLTYAVRGGASQLVLIALGAALLAGGLWGTLWLLGAGGLTIAGYVFLLVPVGVALFGVYVLDIALLARSVYELDAQMFTGRRESVFQRKRTEIPLGAIRHILQQYAPPGNSSPAGAPGTWTTFVSHRALADGRERDFALDGLHSPEEARWLGPLLAGWAGVPLKRGFGPALDEADPQDLPDPSMES